MKLVYKSVILIIILFAMVFCPSCSSAESVNYEPAYQYDREYFSFEEVVSKSTDILTAKYVDKIDSETYCEYHFQVESIIRGETEEKDIYVFALRASVGVGGTDIAYRPDLVEYEAGKSYLLLLERQISVFYDHDRYILFGETYIPTDNPMEAKMYGQKMDEASKLDFSTITAAELQSLVKDEAAKSEAPAYYGTAYVDSDDIYEVVSGSEYIFSIKIKALAVEGVLMPVDTYSCQVLNSYRGELEKSDFGDEIWIGFPRGSVNVGDEYVVLLNKVDENSVIYALSSKSSSVLTKTEYSGLETAG